MLGEADGAGRGLGEARVEGGGEEGSVDVENYEVGVEGGTVGGDEGDVGVAGVVDEAGGEAGGLVGGAAGGAAGGLRAVRPACLKNFSWKFFGEL